MKKDTRLETLDLLRGLTFVSMILYHGMWDFLYLSETGAAMTGLRAWYEGPAGHLWQQSICRTFILLSGFCVPFSRHVFRRGLQVSAAGILVSAVTLLAMYEERVVFGVLTFLGAAMLLTGALRKAGKMCSGSRGGSKPKAEEKPCRGSQAQAEEKPRRGSQAQEEEKPRGGSQAQEGEKPHGSLHSGAAVKAAAAFVCFYLFHVFRWVNQGCLRPWPGVQWTLPAGLYAAFGEGTIGHYVMTGLGFTMPGFFSTDYFSLIPWIFLFWGGMFVQGFLSQSEGLDHPAFHLQAPVLNRMGRHSLLLYLLHQPVLYLLTLLFFS